MGHLFWREKVLHGLLAGNHHFPIGVDDRSMDLIHIPSLTVDEEVLADLKGLLFYEERLLCFLLHLNKKNTNVIYVTSMPVSPCVVDYYLALLTETTILEARSRLHLLTCYDLSKNPLTVKILRRPRLVNRIRGLIHSDRTVLSTYIHTNVERDLASKLGLRGDDAPCLDEWGTKSGSRALFRHCGIPHCEGTYTKLRNSIDIVEAVERFVKRNPTVTESCGGSFIIKLDQGYSGLGNALWDLPSIYGVVDSTTLLESLHRDLRPCSGEPVEQFLAKVCDKGAIVERFEVHKPIVSPSAQGFIDKEGNVQVISTHDQVVHDGIFEGCTFPASPSYRHMIHDYCRSVGEFLSFKGSRKERYGVDFVVWEDHGKTQIKAIEVNLRSLGTTHPLMTLQLLNVRGTMTEAGDFLLPDGSQRCYFATDSFLHKSLKSLTPDDFMDVVRGNQVLQYDKEKATGTVFHMIDSPSTFGKIGVMCIDTSVAGSETRFASVKKALLKECLLSDLDAST